MKIFLVSDFFTVYFRACLTILWRPLSHGKMRSFTMDVYAELAEMKHLLQKIYEELQNSRTKGNDEFLTIPQAASYLNLSISKVYKLTHLRKVRYFKPGKSVYFRRADLDDYIFSNSVETDGETDRKSTLVLLRRAK